MWAPYYDDDDEYDDNDDVDMRRMCFPLGRITSGVAILIEENVQEKEEKPYLLSAPLLKHFFKRHWEIWLRILCVLWP